MIYDNDKVEDGLHAIMFPVREVDIFAETETGKRDRISGKKALINDDTCKVLSVVSDRYELLHNRTALDLAKKCCLAAFPNTAPDSWKVLSVEAPLTGGHCRIDLKHEGKIAGYEWSFSEDDQEEYGPFIRVVNSYNRTSVFSIRFGLIRWACSNGMIDWHSSITVKIAHDVREIERSIEAKINETKFRKVLRDFQDILKPLHETQIQLSQFRPIILSVLKIRKPEQMPENRMKAWECLENYLDEISKKYSKEMGNTGRALVNAITHVASHPPPKTGNYSFIRRERDGLQRLAGIWLVGFSKIVQDKLQDPVEYLKKQIKGNCGGEKSVESFRT